ncbi:MAG: cadherin-like beta sandwich domain-containing protein [Dehalococcoidia bacterium]|nr:MAG: cadherin-like beta sandwich domain-containing protein [Dehalococcoidia bacterium]
MRKKLALIIIPVLILALVGGCSSPAETGLSLTVSQPVDGSVVTVGEVEVRGSTSPGAVVSVNGEIIVADIQGTFAITLPLEEGPNIIEIIASDEEENEASTELIVTLVKGG